MDITVNVDNVDLNSIVGEHYTQTGEEDWHREPQTLGQAVAVKIAEDLKRDEGYRTLKQQVLDRRDEEVREQVKPVVAAAIAASVQPTNTFGQPIGDPVSLTDLIVKEAREALTKRADYGRGPTLLEKVVAEAVDKAIRKELTDVIAEEKAKVVAAVRAKAAELIATAVKEGVGR